MIGSRVIDVRAAYPAATINPEDDFTPPFFDDEESPHEAAIDHVESIGLTAGCADLRFC